MLIFKLNKGNEKLSTRVNLCLGGIQIKNERLCILIVNELLKPFVRNIFFKSKILLVLLI